MKLWLKITIGVAVILVIGFVVAKMTAKREAAAPGAGELGGDGYQPFPFKPVEPVTKSSVSKFGR